MSLLRMIQIHASSESCARISEKSQSDKILDHWKQEDSAGKSILSLLVRSDNSQELIDSIQSITRHEQGSRITIHPIEATLPKIEEEEKPEKEKQEKKPVLFGGISREELYSDVSRGAMLDGNYVLLTILSAIVAAIGLITDNVAVVIGAMVIAPLLGPNMALAFGATIGDLPLMGRSLRTGLTGLGLSLLFSIALATLIDIPFGSSSEIESRTVVGLDSIVLALASGAAAVLSLTTGVSSGLVGVMVAVALLPPTVVLGLCLGGGHMMEAAGAGLLLSVNIVCVNLSAKLIFLLRGIHPYEWYERKNARRALTISLIIWTVSLLLLIGAIYTLHHHEELTDTLANSVSAPFPMPKL